MAWRRPRGQRAAPFDPYEQAAARADAEREAREMGDPLPPVPPRFATPIPRPNKRWLWLLGALVLAAGVARAAARGHAPTVAPNCTRSQLVLSAGSVRKDELVRWTATGPSNVSVVLGLDVAAFDRTANGEYVGRPAAGAKSGDVHRASGVFRLKGCHGSGTFPAAVTPGRHTATLFAVTATGSRPLVSAPLTVTR